MSLTVYFYKTKKGSVPTCKNGTEWASARRAFMTFAICQDMAEKMENKKKIPLFKLDQPTFSRLSLYEYDNLLCEEETTFLQWIGKRKKDFAKYDYFALFA